MLYCCSCTTPLGPATAAADEEALTGFWFAGQKYYPADGAAFIERPGHPAFAGLRRWLDSYFAGENPLPDFALNPGGTPFQKAVWDILLRIPHGKVSTYGAIAAQLAKRRGAPFMSARAVGSAVGHNPISLLIPCHRVVGSDGSLTGYAGGIDKKEFLLRLEQADYSGIRRKRG